VGKTLGAFFGGQIIASGRKRAYVGFGVLSLISSLIMQILSVYPLVIGKFMNGFFVTVVHMAQIKMINETVPVYLLDKYGSIVSALTSLGYFLVFGFG
jgi:hypothetical protein